MEGYKRKEAKRKQRPLLVIGSEGQTEDQYMTSLAAKYKLRIAHRIVNSNRHQLIEETALAAKRVKKKHRGRQVITVVVCDIEEFSDHKIKEMVTHIQKSKSQGVDLLVVNCPKFERWILQHFEPIAPGTSGSEIDRRLERATKRANVGLYSKPGDVRYYTTISHFTDTALENCAASKHSHPDLPCMCELVALLKCYVVVSKP